MCMVPVSLAVCGCSHKTYIPEAPDYQDTMVHVLVMSGYSGKSTHHTATSSMWAIYTVANLGSTAIVSEGILKKGLRVTGYGS